MKREPIRDDRFYNIVRTQGHTRTIFKRNLPGKKARSELAHWKRLARNAGGHVYFDAVAVPPELAPKTPISKKRQEQHQQAKGTRLAKAQAA